MFKFKHQCTPPLHKRRGYFDITIVTILLIVTFISTSLVTLAQATFNSSNSNKVALQAQQYANTKAEIIKATKYDDLAAHERSIIDNSIYQDEVLVEAEKPYPGNDDILQKECTINVYRLNEEHPRYSLKVVRTSVSLVPGVPIGGIIPWYGLVGDIPEGFKLCNGEDGTPNLCGRFIVGAGYSGGEPELPVYPLGDMGGENEVLLEAEQTASHYHRFGRHTGNNTGYFLTSAGDFQLAPLTDWMRAGKWNGSGGGGYNGWDGGSGTNFSTGQNLVTSLAVGVDATKPHENRPPYYALYYIMRVE